MQSIETRKVQRTGKSTLIVSIPKNWAKTNNVLSGSTLFFSKNQYGDLILSVERSEPSLTAKLDIGNKSGEPLIRDIIACYVAGYRTLEVFSPQMSAVQKRDLHQIVNKLIGPEILEETVNKVVIQDLLSSEELQPERALKRIKNITKLMIQDAISALLKKNVDLARDVIQRDNDVDRLNLLVARQFTEILRSGSVRQETSNAVAAFNYMQAASNLERIADHASEIADASIHLNCALPAQVEEELSTLGSSLCVLVEESIFMLLHADSDKANKLIDDVVEIKKQMQIMASSLPKGGSAGMLLKLVVTGSIERILDYVMNINELTINLCNANLEEKLPRGVTLQ
jgi:phosphate uptake regulator